MKLMNTERPSESMRNSRLNELTIRTGVLAGVVGAVAILTAAIIGSSASTQVAALAALALAILFWGLKPGAFHVSAMLLIFQTSQMDFDVPTSQGAIVRAISLGVIVLISLRYGQRQRLHGIREYLAVFLIGICCYLWAIFSSPGGSTVLIDTASFAATGTVLAVTAQYIPRDVLLRGVQGAIFIVVLASFGLYLLAPGLAMEAGRLEGIFRNANTLGFFSSLGVVCALLDRSSKFRITVLLVSGICLVLTGSRAPLLALVVGVLAAAIFVIVRRQRGVRRIVVVAALALPGSWIAFNSSLSSALAILRTNDSRTIGTDYAIAVIHALPRSGVGYGNSRLEIASTPLRWGAECGLPALALVACAYLVFLVFAARRGWAALLLAVFAVTHSLFEGWFLAGGSGIYVAFWLVYFSSTEGPSDTHREPVPIAAENPGLRRHGSARHGYRAPLFEGPQPKG